MLTAARLFFHFWSRGSNTRTRAIYARRLLFLSRRLSKGRCTPIPLVINSLQYDTDRMGTISLTPDAKVVQHLNEMKCETFEHLVYSRRSS
jgi:hypothetical protein